MHTCDEFCAWRITPELLNEHGFPTRIEHIETSMGRIMTTVIVEGEPFAAQKLRAILTAGSPFRPCWNGLGVARPVEIPQPFPGALEWALAHRKDSRCPSPPASPSV